MRSDTASEEQKVTIGVSSCLLGNNVRYDGHNQYDADIVEILQNYCEFEVFCPEVAIGLGVPRPPIHLVRTKDGIRALGVEDRTFDVTTRLQDYTLSLREKIHQLHGFILKSKSPSCGIRKVKLYDSQEHFDLSGQGIFAATIIRLNGNLPLVDENEICTPEGRENFLERAQVYRRWKLLERENTPRKLIEFHTDHKFLILAHDEARYRKLGRLVAQCSSHDFVSVRTQYCALLMETLAMRRSRKLETNVFMHMMGFLKKKIPTPEKRRLLKLIEQFRRGDVARNTVITGFHQLLQKYPDEYLSRQYFLHILMDDSR